MAIPLLLSICVLTSLFLSALSPSKRAAVHPIQLLHDDADREIAGRFLFVPSLLSFLPSSGICFQSCDRRVRRQVVRFRDIVASHTV